MEKDSKNIPKHRVVYLGTLRVGDHFLSQGKRWSIFGQLGDISYCNCGDDDIKEFNGSTRVEVPIYEIHVADFK
jgi:hypothetical protein